MYNMTNSINKILLTIVVVSIPVFGLLLFGCTSQEVLYTPPVKPAPIITEFVVNKNNAVLGKKIFDEYNSSTIKNMFDLEW